MGGPQQLLQQLLALDESVRRELGHALLASLDTWVDDDLTADEQKKLEAVIEQSAKESEAGLGI
ncbi:MAG TPA: hypothetical protein VGM90_26185, partial [Kofleriaceae bacterium]